MASGKSRDKRDKDKSESDVPFRALSPGGEELFGRLPVWLNVLGGLVLVGMLCVPLFL
ncbi:hypothetical protein GCM10022254_59110 [Actinomadura meridiana]|uniref:Uncharacterized protein n=1 Tax=Actinomadura meridiana TaxID=559626 RepID=A0ABP8CHF4_9ACTN